MGSKSGRKSERKTDLKKDRSWMGEESGKEQLRTCGRADPGPGEEVGGGVNPSLEEG
jgi:hypothetical protein